MTGRPVTQFRPPLSPDQAEMINRTRHLGWDAGTLDEANDQRRAMMREGLNAAPRPVPVIDACPACQPALRRARSSGIILGLVLALISFVAGIAVRAAIDVYWPIACDGTATLGGCAARLMGVA